MGGAPPGIFSRGLTPEKSLDAVHCCLAPVNDFLTTAKLLADRREMLGILLSLRFGSAEMEARSLAKTVGAEVRVTLRMVRQLAPHSLAVGDVQCLNGFQRVEEPLRLTRADTAAGDNFMRSCPWAMCRSASCRCSSSTARSTARPHGKR